MVALTLQAPAKIIGQASFRPEDFIAQIEGDGTQLQWERREMCPCRTDQGAARTDCAICAGKGWEYVLAEVVRGIVSGIKYAPKVWEQFGDWGFGVVSLSLRWEHTPAFGDRFTLLNGVIERQEIVKHQGVVDALKFTVAPVTMDLMVNGKVQATPVATLYCRLQTATGLGGPLRVEGTDYVVDADGKIDWTLGVALGTAPVVGTWYSIRYLMKPRYIVIEHPYAIRQVDSSYKSASQASQALPVSVLARLDWLPEPEAGP